MIFSDFSFPEIDWSAFNLRGGKDTIQAKFFDAVNDMYLVQHIDFPTRFRHGQEPLTLDLIFMNKEYMIDNIESVAPLGKSDHISLVWSFITYGGIVSKINWKKCRNYCKGDYVKVNSDLGSTDWRKEGLKRGVNSYWSYMKDMIYSKVKDNGPLVEKTGRRPKAS